ncbi:hypothetical protein EMIT019CA3_210038 [Bacillus pseudomycoides]
MAKNAKDRMNYSLGKTNFVTEILEKAMKSYKDYCRTSF